MELRLTDVRVSVTLRLVGEGQAFQVKGLCLPSLCDGRERSPVPTAHRQDTVLC